MDWITEPLVRTIVFPFLAGLVCLLLPRGAARVRSGFAVLAAAVTLLLVWPLFLQGDGTFNGGGWLLLRIDGLSAFVLLAVSAFALLIALYSSGFMQGRDRHREYYAWLLWTLAASNGAVLANDLVLLLVFWGLLGWTLYLMIGLAGPDAAAAAKKSFVIIGGTDSLLVLGVALVWTLGGSTRMDGPALALDQWPAGLALLCFLAAALAKAGAFPLHTWLPDCGEKAHAPVTAYLPASLDKLLGIYLLARSVMDLFASNATVNTLLMLLGAVTVIAAVMMAMVQHDLKRLLAYHAVSQVGYMVLGIGTGTLVGVAGGLFHMVNNAIYKSCLFLGAGAVEHRTGTTNLDRLGGLAGRMPLTFAACLIAALSISGIPPLNGFASKWMVYLGIIQTAENGGGLWVVWLVAAMLGSALTLASFVKVLHATFLCKPAPEIERREIREVGAPMWIPMVVLAAVCILFGVFAFRLPVPHLIEGALDGPLEVTGVWWAGQATLLLGVALAVGLLIYAVTMRGGKVRRCGTYIGGEKLDEALVTGAARGADRHIEVTGVDFYETIESLAPFKTLYRMAAAKVFDLYEVLMRGMFYGVELLRRAHTGVLPVYLTWIIVGLLAVLYVLRKTGVQ